MEVEICYLIFVFFVLFLSEKTARTV